MMEAVKKGECMTKGRWFVFIAICLVVFGVLILNTKSSEVTVNTVDPSKVITASKPIPDHVFGTEAKKVVLIEYGDFQCPACGNLYPSLKPLKERYKDQLTFVFRDFPLTSLHPNALAGAAAAEAAGLQGKFWQMHDVLYENQTEWSTLDSDKRTGQFVTYATRLQLDASRFKKDIDSDKVLQKIKRDQALGKKIGASATPTLVLNGKTLEQNQWQTPERLESTLRDAIKASGQSLPEKTQ
jgi:protein-disulfide isomerase